MKYVQKYKGAKFIFLRNGVYTYIRTVPKKYRHRFKNRSQIWRSLETDDPIRAIENSLVHIREFDAIVRGEREFDPEAQVTHSLVAARAESLGILFQSSKQIKEASDEDAIASLSPILRMIREMSQPKVAEVAALAGAVEIPALNMDEALSLFFKNNPEFVANLNEVEANAKRAKYDLSVRDFKARMGDHDVTKLTESTAIDYQLKLKQAVVDKEFKSAHANRHFANIRRIIDAVRQDKSYRHVSNPFVGLKRFDFDDAGKRQAFTEAEVETIKKALPTARLPDEDKLIIKLGEITGAGQKELCWLTGDDISLDGKIPHIRIAENELRRKVKGGGTRHRDVPIVDPAVVDELRNYPNGFERYHDPLGPGRLYNHLQKFFRKHTPGKSHGGYRHRMDDLLKMSGVDIGLKCSLTGHQIDGKALYYGQGAKAYKLSQKKEALETALAYAKVMHEDI